MDPFLSAHAAQHGLTPDQARRLPHPTHGVVAPDGDTVLAQRCRAVLVALPDGAVLTHLTVARLLGWWLPRLPDPDLVIACSDGDAPHHDRRGVFVRRCAMPAEHRTMLGELPVASAEWTINELAEDLSLLDLVVVIDSALRAGHTTIARLQEAAVRGRRGVRTLRRALTLADGRSESPWETLLRLLHVLCGIPVEPQVELRDPMTGDVLWRLDLLIVGTNRAPEYDGADHTRPDVRRRDLRRDKVLVRDRIERFAYTAVDVTREAAGVIRDAEDALGLPHDASRLKIWTAEFEASSFSRSGYARLLRRLRRFERREPPRRRRAA